MNDRRLAFTHSLNQNESIFKAVSTLCEPLTKRYQSPLFLFIDWSIIIVCFLVRGAPAPSQISLFPVGNDFEGSLAVGFDESQLQELECENGKLLQNTRACELDPGLP